MSTQSDSSLPAIGLFAPEGRDYLWGKTKAALKYIHNYHLNDADWFLKADDDTYVIVENLQSFLHGQNPAEPVHFGRRFKADNPNGFMSGGAGYVLSKEALVRFIRDALPHRHLCKWGHKGMEDIELGQCLDNVGVYAGDSRDHFGGERFHPFTPEDHLIPGWIKHNHDWFYILNFYPRIEGPGCCSDSVISFHYISPNTMYVLDYFVYRVRPLYNISNLQWSRRELMVILTFSFVGVVMCVHYWWN